MYPIFQLWNADYGECHRGVADHNPGVRAESYGTDRRRVLTSDMKETRDCYVVPIAGIRASRARCRISRRIRLETCPFL